MLEKITARLKQGVPLREMVSVTGALSAETGQMCIYTADNGLTAYRARYHDPKSDPVAALNAFLDGIRKSGLFEDITTE